MAKGAAEEHAEADKIMEMRERRKRAEKRRIEREKRQKEQQELESGSLEEDAIDRCGQYILSQAACALIENMNNRGEQRDRMKSGSP